MKNIKSDDTQSRKWQITINNPEDKGYTTEHIREIIEDMKTITYAIWSFEVGGETGTRHTHIFLYGVNAIRFSKLLKEFNGGHFEVAKGTVQQNRDYVLKQGKWKNDPKGDTRIDGEQYEYAEILMELLSMEGVQCDYAENGKIALECFEASDTDTYAMILMDVKMPVMDGYEAAAAIRAGTHPCAQTIPIVALTANAFKEDIQQALDAGMNEHIAKPVRVDKIKAAVSRLVKR